MQEFNYHGWRINCQSNQATRELSPNSDLIKISLVKTEDKVPFEGWWPMVPNEPKSVMITGICLWDARWQIEFEQPKKTRPPARRTLALSLERKQTIEKIASGAKITKVHYPLSFGIYHQTLIAWQAKKIQQLKPERILYHLPTEEYHDYIRVLETSLKISLSSLHTKLDLFVQNLVSYMKHTFDESFMKKIEFISPYAMDASNPIDSDLLPYRFPEKFGAKNTDVYGVEDLAQARLAYTAFKQGGEYFIPVLGGIIGSPSPYFNSKELINTDFIEV